MILLAYIFIQCLLINQSVSLIFKSRDVDQSNVFSQKTVDLIIDLNCSVLRQSFEIFKPKLDNDKFYDLKFILNYLNEDNLNDYPFELIANRVSVVIKRLKNITSLKSFYKLKLIASSNENKLKDELYLNLNINKTTSDCSIDDNAALNNSDQIKILFADSLFSDFSEIIFENKMDFDKNINKTYMANLDENTQIDSFICYILIKSSSTQLNINGNGKDKFRLEQVDYGSTSFISASSAQQTKISPLISLYSLKLAEELDRELQDSYKLRISLQNHDDSFIDLNIVVDDVNDNEPIFEKFEYRFDILENSFKNNCVGFVKAIDNDAKQNGKIKYSIDNLSFKLYKDIDSKLEQDLSNYLDFNEYFYLNEISGEICVLISLDRECYSKYTFEVVAQDFGTPISLKTSKKSLVIINVLDINDNSPIFFEQSSQNNFNIAQTCNLINKTQSLLSNRSKSLNLSENYPQYYIQENSAPNTFIAWLKAFDLDSDHNSQIDYYLEIINSQHQIFDTQNYYEDHFFTIDSNGIVRSMVSFNIIDKENGNAKSSIEIDESKVWIHKTNFLIKIIAKDRGKPSLQNEILINIKITNQKEKRKLNLSLMPNKTTIWIPKDISNIYEHPLVRISNDLSNNKKLVYQLIPFTDIAQNINTKLNKEEDDLEYGKNCSQTDIIKYFTLNKNGEIYLSKNMINNFNLNNRSNYMVCFVNVRVIDLSNLYQMSSNIEFTFIIYNNNNNDNNNDSMENNFESILIRDQLLKKLNNFKKKIYFLYKNKSSKMITFGMNNGVHNNQLIDEKSQTLAFNIRKVFGESLHFYLLVSCSVLLATVIIFIFIYKFILKDKKLFNNRNENTFIFFSNLIQILKSLFDLKTKSNSSMSNKPSVGNDTDSNATIDNNSSAKCKLNEINEINKTSKNFDLIFEIFRKNKNSKDEENLNNKSLSSTNESSKSNLSLEIKDDSSINEENNKETESGVYSLKHNTPSIQINNIQSQFSSPSKLPRLDSLENTVIENKNNLDLLLNGNIEEIESIKSSLRSFLIKEENSNSNNQQQQQNQESSLNLKLNKTNNSGGIYQVSNQILIDYDDNTTCEINSSILKQKQTIIECSTNINNSTKSILKTDKNKLISNGIINDHSDRCNVEPLERFEKIYYQNPLSVYSYNSTPNETKNLSNIGSFV